MTPSPLRSPATVLLLALAAALCGPRAAAQEIPSTPPSPRDVLGWEMGEQFTDVASLGLYFRTLERTTPLVSVHPYGRTWEGRPLLQVLVASEAHRERLDEILALNRELTDPDTPEARSRQIIASGQPAVIYFSYGVHGNESSSSEAAMWTAWDLVRGAPEVASVLDSAIVIIDPALNPDGRERYVDFYNGARGAEPNPNPEAREHAEPWPGGRTNHYLFDLNRDWTWLSQIETRARLATWDRWNPQVHVDFHEMSYRSSYFFFPAADPFNPIYPENTRKWGRIFGEANAADFDRHGWLYYTGESYDHFYPGYGDTWPSLMGAIGMTYEQAGGGGAGLAVERPDGTVLTLADRALHHRTTGQATARTAAARRTELLGDFAAFHRTVDAGHPDFLLVEGADPTRARALVDLLRAQGVEVERASRAFRADATPHAGWEARRDFPAGTYRVRARQPRGRLAVTLLQAETELDATFSYDISAWSLPYGFGVEAQAVDGTPDAGWAAVRDEVPPGAGVRPGAPGYLVAPAFAGMAPLVDFLEAGGRAVVLSAGFTAAGRAWPAGTLFLPRGLNPDLDALVEGAGLEGRAVAVTTLLSEVGRDLGTEESGILTLPRVALLGGEGTSSGSFGAQWYFLDQRLGLPFDPVNVEDLGGTDLAQYDVIAVPSTAGLARVLGESGMERLMDWVRGGGHLVAVARGAQEIAEAAGVAMREDPEADEGDRDERLARALRTGDQRDLEAWESETPGAILPVRLDPGNPLAFGAGLADDPTRAFVLSTGTSFEPAEGLESAAWFPDGVREVSGVVSPGTLERLDRSAWMVRRSMGAGSVVLFADDPIFRIMWYAGFQPWVNAILLAPVL